MIVRAAGNGDLPVTAAILGAVAEEGGPGHRADRNVGARAETFRMKIQGDGPAALRVLGDHGEIVGHAALHGRVPGCCRWDGDPSLRDSSIMARLLGDAEISAGS